MTLEAKRKLSLISRGIHIKVYNGSNNLMYKFTSLKETAKHFKVSPGFIQKCINNTKDFKGFNFRPEIENNRIGIYDPEKKLIEVLDNPMKISKAYDIPRTTVYRNR